MNITGAAKAGSTSFQTAKRALTVGWPKKKMAAISEVLKRDATEARAQLHAMNAEAEQRQNTRLDLAMLDEHIRRNEAETKAREHAITVRADEGKMCDMTRKTVIGGLATALQLNGAAAALMKKWLPIIQKGRDPLSKKPLTLSQGLRFMEVASRVAERHTSAARAVLEMERLVMGQPTEILGISPVSMTIEEAQEMQAAAADAMEILKDRSLRKERLQLVQGGQS